MKLIGNCKLRETNIFQAREVNKSRTTELRESEERYWKIVEGTDDLITRLDNEAQDNRVRSWVTWQWLLVEGGIAKGR